MNLENVDDRLRRIIAETLNLEQDYPSELMEQEGIEKWDSMGHLFLIMEIEKEFAVSFKTDRIPKLTSFILLKSEILDGSLAADD